MSKGDSTREMLENQEGRFLKEVFTSSRCTEAYISGDLLKKGEKREWKLEEREFYDTQASCLFFVVVMNLSPSNSLALRFPERGQRSAAA